MDLKRFFTDDIDEKNGIVALYGDEFFHAVKVTRHKVGYKLIVCNNTPFDYYCTITEIGKDRLLAKIDEIVANDTELSTVVRLYIGLNKDVDTVVQKAVELGVREIVPFLSDHGNVGTIHKDRLEKIVLESAKQCGRSVLPTVSDVLSLSDAIECAKGTDILFFYEFERNNRVKDQVLSYDEISVFIGPEGGFSEREKETFVKANAHVLTLGKRILRVATAVVSALTLVNERLEEA